MYYICFCKQTKTKKMSKIIDIEALSKMPITDEFRDLLIHNMYPATEIKVSMNSHKSIVYFEHHSMPYVYISIYECGTIELEDDYHPYFNNAFQIVRYIDNYLRLNNHNESVKSIVQSAFNLLKINKND